MEAHSRYITKIIIILFVIFVLITACAPSSLLSSATTIEEMIDAASPGDTITVRTGTYPESRIVVTKPLTLEADGVVKVTHGFSIQADNVTIRGFDIANTVISDAGGILVDGDNCLIEDNYIHNTAREGIYFYNVDGCIVRNNRIYQAQRAGLYIKGQNHTVENNEIWETMQYGPLWPDYLSGADADGIRFFGSGHVFRGNYIHDIETGTVVNPDPHADGFQTFGGADNCLFEDNVIHVYGHGTAGFQLEDAHHLTIRNNIISGVIGLLGYGNNAGNHTVEHNTIYGSLDYPTNIYPSGVQLDGSGHVVNNNIIMLINGPAFKMRPAEAINNLLYRTSAGLGTDPMLDSDYRPLPGSPACLSNGGYVGAYPCGVVGTSTPTPTAITPTLIKTPTRTPASPTMTSTLTMTPTLTPTLTPTVTITQSPTPTFSPTLTVTPTPVVGVAVNIYGDHVSSVKGLNLRCEKTLYGTCNYGYLLPYCGYVDDRDCNPNFDSVILTEVVFVDGGYLHREDTGYWGKWGDGYIAMCLDKRDYDFVDWVGCAELR